MAKKNAGTNREIYKARSVVEGQTDCEKNLLAHTAANVTQETFRMLIAIAAFFGLRIGTQGIS